MWPGEIARPPGVPRAAPPNAADAQDRSAQGVAMPLPEMSRHDSCPPSGQPRQLPRITQSAQGARGEGLLRLTFAKNPAVAYNPYVARKLYVDSCVS